MHNLFPNPQAGIPFEHLVFLNNQRQDVPRFLATRRACATCRPAFFVFGDVDNDGDEDCFAGPRHPARGPGQRAAPQRRQRPLHREGRARASRTSRNSRRARASPTSTATASSTSTSPTDGPRTAARHQLFFGNGDGTFTERPANAPRQPEPARKRQSSPATTTTTATSTSSSRPTASARGSAGRMLWENDGSGHFTNVADARGFAAQATGNYWLVEHRPRDHGRARRSVDVRRLQRLRHRLRRHRRRRQPRHLARDDLAIRTASATDPSRSGPIRRSCSSTRARPAASRSRTCSRARAAVQRGRHRRRRSSTSTTTVASISPSPATTNTSPTTRRPSSSAWFGLFAPGERRHVHEHRA